MMVYAFIGLFVLGVVFKGCESGGSSHSPTLFESGTKKIDSGRSNEVTPQEARRIEEIMSNGRKK